MTRAMPVPATPDPGYLSQLTQRLRVVQYGRPEDGNEWTGCCGTVAEVLAARYGWQEDGGCYQRMEDGRHVAHLWNILPDGRILDATADQFGEPDVEGKVRVTAGDDPRYLGTCEGEDCKPL